MPSKIEDSLTPEQLQEFFKRALQLKGTKLKDIKVLAAEFDIEISLMSAKTFRDGAFQKHLDRIDRAQKQIAQLKEVMADGTDTIDAALKLSAGELLDQLTNGEAEIDLGEVSKIIQRLMTSRARKEIVDQNAAKLAADLRLQEERIAVLVSDREERERKLNQIADQVTRAKNAPAASADEVRAAAVKEIDRIMGITK